MVRERYGKKNRDEAEKLIQALYKAEGYADINLREYTKYIRECVRLAKEYNRIQEAACNGELSESRKTRETNIEKLIEHHIEALGLTVSFSGDPRGYCVKIHNQTNTLYNTWGGAESGYGIGEI